MVLSARSLTEVLRDYARAARLSGLEFSHLPVRARIVRQTMAREVSDERSGGGS